MKREGLSSRQLAFKAGVHPSYITRMLAGERNPPSGDVIKKISRALKLDFDELLWYAHRVPMFMRTDKPPTNEDVKALRRFLSEIRRRKRLV